MAMISDKPEWQASYNTIYDANLHLLESGKFSDVTFVVGSGKTEIPAHKLILMTRSSVFETMFERWETGDNTKVEIPEVDSTSFIKFLDFLYTDNVVSISGKVTAEVLYLAHKYNVPKLALKCSNILSQSIVVKNAIDLNQIASKLQQEALRTQTEAFILRNGKAVLLDCGFLEIHEDALGEFLRKDDLRVDELTVFRAVMSWAENQCKRLKLETTVENLRVVLKDLLPLIRFPLMSPKDFTDEVIRKNKGLLTDDESIALYMHFTTGLPIPTSPRLPFTIRKRAGGIVFYVNFFKSSEAAQPDMRQILASQPNMRQVLAAQSNKRKTETKAVQTICRSQTSLTGSCETTVSIRTDRDIRIQAIVLDQDDSNKCSSGYKPLIRSITGTLMEEYDRHRRINVPNYCFETLSPYQEFKTSILISMVDSGGRRIRLHEQQVEDATKIEFGNGIYVDKTCTCEFKLTTTGSSVATLNSKIGRNELVHSASEKVNCESDVVTFAFSAAVTNCVVRNQKQQYTNSNCVCISAGHIKALHFTI